MINIEKLFTTYYRVSSYENYVLYYTKTYTYTVICYINMILLINNIIIQLDCKIILVQFLGFLSKRPAKFHLFYKNS